jgi:hypothetical protein
VIVLERDDWLGGRFEFHIDESLATLDPFQAQGAPCFEAPATDEDWTFLFGNDPEEEYQP